MNTIELLSLKATVFIKLSDVVVKAKPSSHFTQWLLSNPTLSIIDFTRIENFYEDKTVHNKPFRPLNREKYNSYKSMLLENNEGVIYLDEYFVDETCVTFLIYRGDYSKVQSFEIMLEF